MILPAQEIRELGAIIPCLERNVCQGMTYGLGPAGYDVRIDNTIWLWPNYCRLASTWEYFRLPNDVIAIVHDKSTWARRGVTVQNTVIEPGWQGYLTLELTLHTWGVMRIAAGSPIAQIIFHRLAEPTEMPYTGKYQNQPRGPQRAR